MLSQPVLYCGWQVARKLAGAQGPGQYPRCTNSLTDGCPFKSNLFRETQGYHKQNLNYVLGQKSSPDLRHFEMER